MKNAKIFIAMVDIMALFAAVWMVVYTPPPVSTTSSSGIHFLDFVSGYETTTDRSEMMWRWIRSTDPSHLAVWCDESGNLIKLGEDGGNPVNLDFPNLKPYTVVTLVGVDSGRSMSCVAHAYTVLNDWLQSSPSSTVYTYLMTDYVEADIAFGLMESDPDQEIEEASEP